VSAATEESLAIIVIRIYTFVKRQDASVTSQNNMTQNDATILSQNDSHTPFLTSIYHRNKPT